MNSIIRLPVEILREIFRVIIFQHIDKSDCQYVREDCMCWQLDILNSAIVCKSWYRVCLELMHSKQVNAIHHTSWISLINYASFQRTYPLRSKLVHILRESYLANLNFHKQVKHIVIDFALFDTIRREKLANNVIVRRKVHHAEAFWNTIELIRLCQDIQRLDILFDAGFTSLTSHEDQQDNRIQFASFILSKALSGQRIKELALVGYNPIQRCPCCAGKEWDHYLDPLMTSLTSLETLVLQNVLPSTHLFEQLSRHPNLNKIVFYKSMVTIPTQRRGDTSSGFLTSVNQIPRKLWRQVKTVEILEDIEDATTWKCKRYLNELVEHVGPQLESFVLQFGTKEEIERYVKEGFQDGRKDKLFIQDVKSPLHQLKRKCKDSLKQVLLINVPPV